MTADPVQMANVASWVATIVGLLMVVWGWLREQDAIRRLRLQDCGLVLVFAAVLTRIVVQERPMGVFDWVLVFLGPLFIGAALWRLARTGALPKR
ncbi:MAG: hypothetical protein EON91_03090 [Brevundimonas sp.]|uniref:hypothetical protein n=1 Tax=Brevundimonas sp. TaxID=1871086 RepID=UPI0012093F6C|nr:hypothetical protein [Brevundimonas sp.]RZJ19020.1 MAG: hypothetical protein EON91_03090 [Brevundimonas sp.]